MSLNDRFFGFDLWGFSEGLQFTEYKSSGSKYDDHIDRSCNGVIRKLSVVIQLTDPKKYKGCDLELITSMTPNKMSRERGHLVIFPSYILHRVTPLERGTRHSLVGWVTGKPFK
jgi:PKHD-type hydroxylase